MIARPFLLAALLGATSLGAQPSAAPPAQTERRVAGQVVVAKDSATTPVVGAWVTLHRVASDAAGPLDSMRTDMRGSYTFRYRPTGADDALYFASTRYGDVAYFTPPLRGDAVIGEAAEITVFDTTSAHVPTTVRGRHLIVSAASADGTRRVIEVFEVSNDTSVTLVDRAGDARGTWATPIPAKARQAQVRDGEVPADALSFAGGRAVLHMPLAPGLKQIAFSYVLPGDAFPFDLTTEAGVTVFEVLVEDPRGTVTGPRLAGVDPVTVEGRSFRRFLAQDVPRGSHIVVDMPPPSPSWIRWVVPALLAIVGIAMVGTLFWPRRRRQDAVAAPPPVTISDADQLARAIAALDDEFERKPDPTDVVRATYDEQRRVLKAQLAAALSASLAAK